MTAGNVDKTGICVGCGVSTIDEICSTETIVNAIAEGFGR